MQETSISGVPQQVVPIGTSTSSAKCVAICLSVSANSKCVMEQVGCTAIRPSFLRIVQLRKQVATPRDRVDDGQTLVLGPSLDVE